MKKATLLITILFTILTPAFSQAVEDKKGYISVSVGAGIPVW